MPKTKDKRQSRITVACNACRSRKQKCSGAKPVCEQCLEYHRPCDWPEQLRRGPAKGHVEALEHRLQVTEGVLLKLLAEIPDRQLMSLFPDNPGTRSTQNAAYTPLARLEKKGVDDWSGLPLDTAQNIRKWEEACTNQAENSTGDQAVGTASSVAERSEPQEKRRKIDHTANHNLGSMAIHPDHPTHDERYLSSPSLPISDVNEQPGAYLPRLTGERMFKGIWPTQKEPAPKNDAQSEASPPKQSRSSWEGAPSLNFQQQFLW